MNSLPSSFEPVVGQVPKQIPGIPNLTLNDKTTIPLLGYGFGSANYKADSSAPLDKNIIKAGVDAIKSGFYHLDAAQG